MRFANSHRFSYLQSSVYPWLGSNFDKVISFHHAYSCVEKLILCFSRSGEPKWSSVASSPDPPSWSKQVSWQKANILKPAEYSHLLEGADAVVHSMGILLEADYKGVLLGKESIWSGLQRAFSPTKAGTQNPLEKREEYAPQEKDGQLTYEIMNRDSGRAQ
jgi:hypothetical protein